MHPLTYKQQRQFANALRRTFSSPRQLLTTLVVIGYGGLSMSLILLLLLMPLPGEVSSILEILGISDDLREQIQGFRGALTLTLLMISSVAVFQNPLLRFANADIDILFTTPIPLWRVMVTRIVLNHLRTFLAAYFFWGLALVPLLRFSGYEPWPLGLWGMLAVLLLFSSVDQLFATIQVTLIQGDQSASNTANLWVGRGVLLLLTSLIVLAAGGLIDRLITGEWQMVGELLTFAGGPVISALLLPLSLAAGLLLLPVQTTTAPLLALVVLLVFDLALVALLLRQVSRGGAGVLLETSLSPTGRPSGLDQLLVDVGFNPVRLFSVLWRGEWSDTVRREQQSNSRVRFGVGASAHLWRRLTELQRMPLGNGLAVLVLGIIPLALYNPTEPYSMGRLVTAIIFSASLGTQLFNDAADHLRYANLELSAPIPRWRMLLAAFVPRLLLYWLGGLLLLIGVATLSPGADWFEIGALGLWYPMMLTPLLALRATLVFFYPAAGIPGQRDPLQAMLVALINGLLVLGVIMLSLVPFGVLLWLFDLFTLNRVWFWPIVYSVSSLISLVTCGAMIWSYQRYEPDE